MLTDPQTAVGYSVILQKEGMKDAAEYLVLQVLEKSTTGVEMMVKRPMRMSLAFGRNCLRFWW